MFSTKLSAVFAAVALSLGLATSAIAADAVLSGDVNAFCNFGTATPGTMTFNGTSLASRNAGGSAATVDVSQNLSLGVDITSTMAFTLGGSAYTSANIKHDTAVSAGPNTNATPSGDVTGSNTGTLTLSGPGNDTIAVHAHAVGNDSQRPMDQGTYTATVSLTCTARNPA